MEMENRQTEWKAINEGVRQGSGPSSVLFVIYMNTIIKEWRQNHVIL
jgi:hypothetical protein